MCGSGMRGCTKEREAIHQSLEKEMDKLTESRLPHTTLLYIVLYFLNDLMFRDKIIIISPIGFTRAVVSYIFFV